MRIKRNAALFLALIMFATTFMATSVSAAGLKDMDSHWAKPIVDELVDKGVLNPLGMGDGNFAPELSVTRAQYARMLNQTLKLTEKSDVQLQDVKQSDWFADDIAIAVKKGYLTPVDNTVKPNETILRTEAAKMCAIAMGLSIGPVAATQFLDDAEIPDAAKPYVNAVHDKKIFVGSLNKLDPNGKFTRAQSATTIFNILKNQEEQAALPKDVTVTGTTYGNKGGELTVVEGNLNVINPGTTVHNVKVKGDLIIAKSVSNGDVTLNKVEVLGTTQVLGGGGNSIHFLDSIIAKLMVASKNTAVRVVFEGTTKATSVEFTEKGKIDVKAGAVVETVVLSSSLPKDAAIEITGNLGKLQVAAQVALKVVSGTIANLVVDATAKGATITLNKDVQVTVAKIDAAAAFKGTGKIAEATITVKGVTTETPPTKITEGSTAPTTPSLGGGGGGGGGGSSTVDVTGVSVINDYRVLETGDTFTVGATVSPSNATTKTITWTSSTPAAATVNSSGVVTAVAPGQTTITATSAGKTATVTVTVIAASDSFKNYPGYSVTISDVAGFTFVVVKTDTVASAVKVAVSSGTPEDAKKQTGNYSNEWRYMVNGTATIDQIAVTVTN